MVHDKKECDTPALTLTANTTLNSLKPNLNHDPNPNPNAALIPTPNPSNPTLTTTPTLTPSKYNP